MMQWLEANLGVILLQIVSSGIILGLLRLGPERKKLRSESTVADANAVDVITQAAARMVEESRKEAEGAKKEAEAAKKEAERATRRAEAAERRARGAEESALASARSAAECAAEVQRLRVFITDKGLVAP